MMTAAKNGIQKSQLRKRRGRAKTGPIETARLRMTRRPSRNKSKPAVKKAKRSAAKAPAKTPAKAPPKSGQWVYTFGGGKAQGRANMRELLGGKGAGLAEMANLGLPVPPGFTITTAVCTHYYANANSYPRDLEKQVDSGLAHIAR